MNEKGGIGLGGLIVIIFLVWFFFFRVDYKDYWYDGYGNAFVTYCGQNYSYDCESHPTEYLPVYHIEKAKAASDVDKWIHTWKISFNNGGYVEAEGTCHEASSAVTFKRVCYAFAYDDYGNQAKYEIHD